MDPPSSSVRTEANWAFIRFAAEVVEFTSETRKRMHFIPLPIRYLIFLSPALQTALAQSTWLHSAAPDAAASHPNMRKSGAR